MTASREPSPDRPAAQLGGRGGADPENPHAGQGAVLLDIGGDIGALVVRMPSELVGVEVEIGVLGGDHTQWHGEDQHGDDHVAHHRGHAAHVAVVARPTQIGMMHSLVYPELPAGRYELWRKPDGPVALTVEVRGGEVTDTDWPPAEP